MNKKFDPSVMPPLPGDLRELVLFHVQDVQKILVRIEELLCFSEEEEKNE